MILIPTTLVLGAGASFPYGFPLAEKLLRNVAKIRENASAANIVAHAADVNREDVYEFCETLAASQAPSVDTFLEANMDLSNIGRAAMAYDLIGCCKGASLALMHDKWNDRGRWYQRLWARLIEDAPTPEQFRENRLTVVTFNYDLSLERFLHQSIQHFYRRGLDPDAALELLNDTIPIVHAYGSLSPVTVEMLHWPPAQPERGQPMLTLALENMLIVPDIEAARAESLIHAKKLMSYSKRVASIGFSFGKANVRRLTYNLENRLSTPTKIDLCVTGMGRGECVMAEQLVRNCWSRGHNRVTPARPKLNGDKFLREIDTFV